MLKHPYISFNNVGFDFNTQSTMKWNWMEFDNIPLKSREMSKSAENNSIQTHYKTNKQKDKLTIPSISINAKTKLTLPSISIHAKTMTR